ncbi:hypothetical protein OAM07_03605 [Crocinitomicaceae bacterium]|nr:hypothetical protein [Crocinitomicaceae bacterium]
MKNLISLLIIGGLIVSCGDPDNPLYPENQPQNQYQNSNQKKSKNNNSQQKKQEKKFKYAIIWNFQSNGGPRSGECEFESATKIKDYSQLALQNLFFSNCPGFESYVYAGNYEEFWEFKLIER